MAEHGFTYVKYFLTKLSLMFDTKADSFFSLKALDCLVIYGSWTLARWTQPQLDSDTTDNSPMESSPIDRNPTGQ